MNILLLGGSGQCGRWINRLARERGHAVRRIVRRASIDGLEDREGVIEGDVLDRDVLASALEGQDVVLSALGLRRASPLPWSRLQSPPDLVQRVMATLGSLCSVSGAPPIVWISAGGAGESVGHASVAVRRLIRLGNVGVAYRDLDAAEENMQRSAARNIVVRPVTLRGGPSEARACPVRRYSVFSMVRRSAVARWMVDVADGTHQPEALPMMLGSSSTG